MWLKRKKINNYIGKVVTYKKTGAHIFSPHHPMKISEYKIFSSDPLELNSGDLIKKVFDKL